MKMICGIINPSKLEVLKKALWTAGYRGVTVSEARGFGFQRSRIDQAKTDDYIVEFSPKVRVEVAVKDEDMDKVAEVILDAVRSGRIGDGKIFVYPLDQIIRVRTGERGETAI